MVSRQQPRKSWRTDLPPGPPTHAMNGTSQIRYCGERTLPGDQKASSEAAASRSASPGRAGLGPARRRGRARPPGGSASAGPASSRARGRAGSCSPWSKWMKIGTPASEVGDQVGRGGSELDLQSPLAVISERPGQPSPASHHQPRPPTATVATRAASPFAFGRARGPRIARIGTTTTSREQLDQHSQAGRDPPERRPTRQPSAGGGERRASVGTRSNRTTIIGQSAAK